MKKYTVEAFGTFALTLVVALSLAGSFPVSTPVLAVLVVGLFVYAVGHISGSHINPAVTIGLWSIKKISSSETIKYIIAQFIGAGVAMFVFSQINNLLIPVTYPLSGSLAIALAELIGMLFYGFFIAAVVYEKTPSYLSGLIIAGGLLFGLALASLLGSAGIINPAVAFGIGAYNPMYFLGPLIGSIFGMQIYRYLNG